MALTIVSQPPELAPVRQPLRLVLQTNNYLINAGTKARLRIGVNGSANNQQFTLQINGRTYTFVARTTPDANSAFEFAANGDSELAVANILGMLQANPFIADNYDLTFNSFPFWVQLEAKVPAESWTMVFGSNTTNFQQATNVAGISPAVRPNFKALLYITAAGRTWQKEARVDALNRCEFVLEEMLDNLLSVTPPALNVASKSYLLVQPLSYALGYAESFGDDPLVQRRSSISARVLPGLFDKVNIPTAAVSNYITPSDSRLQWVSRPSSLRVKPHHKVLLAMYRAGTAAQVDLLCQYQLYTPDGFLQAPDPDVNNDEASFAQDGIVCAYLSVNDLINSMIGAPASTIYQLVLQLRCGTSSPVVSTPLTLDIDHAPATSESILLFKTAAGLFELVYFEGDAEQAVNTTRSFAEHLLPANYTSSQGEVREVEVTRQKRYVLHTGNRRRDYIVWLQELVGSDEVYLLSTDLTQRTRVNLVSHSNDLTATNQELFSMQVTIQEAFIDRA